MEQDCKLNVTKSSLGALVVVLHNISQAHDLINTVASEGICVFYDTD